MLSFDCCKLFSVTVSSTLDRTFSSAITLILTSFEMGFLPPREVYHPVVDIYIPVYEERVSYFPFRFRRSKCNRVVFSYWVFHSSLCRIQWSSPRLGHYEQSFKANNKRSTRFDDPLRHNPERKRGTEEAFKQNFVRTSGEGSAD